MELLCKHCGIIAEPKTENKGQHVKASCSACGRYIKFISQGGEYTFYLGKYKGKTLKEVMEEDFDYVHWCLENWDDKKSEKLQEAVNQLTK